MSSLRRLLLAQTPPSQIIVVSDSFNRPNGIIGKAETGQTWSNSGIGWVVANGMAKQNNNGNAGLVIDSGLVNCDISVIGTFFTQIAIVFRWTNISNYYRFRVLNNNTAAIIRVANGAASLISSIPITATRKDYSLRVVNIGSSIRCYLDGVLIIDANDSTYLTQTKQGLLSDNTENYFDNYIVKTV